jgi:hypothetical protein
MDAKREKILVEGAMESACHKAGKLFIQGEILTRDKFKELFLSSVKIPEDICTNCSSMMVVETEYGKHYKYTFLINYLAGIVYYYRCSFEVLVPGNSTGFITTNVWIEE